MLLRQYEPFDRLNQLQREVNRFFAVNPLHRLPEEAEPATSNWHPAVDIKEESHQFVIYADVPGVESKDIEITLENGTLTLKGRRLPLKTEAQQNYQRIERTNGHFLRRFTLPNTVDAAGISARSQNGVLEVVIPKNQQAQTRKITIEN